jgi:hypothetical protein
MKEAFFGMEIIKMTGVDLIIAGSNDFTYYHSLEIVFKDVFHIFVNAKWEVETKLPFLGLMNKEDAFDYNGKFKIEQGHSIFTLAAEDFDQPFCVVAKDIQFNEDTVFYYKRENLKKGERLADWI